MESVPVSPQDGAPAICGAEGAKAAQGKRRRNLSKKEIEAERDQLALQLAACKELNQELLEEAEERANLQLRHEIEVRKRAEDKLITLSSAVEQSPVSVVITDIHGAIEYVNPKFTQVTGYTLDEVKGQNPRFLKSGETSPKQYRKLWQKITSGGQWQGQFHNRAKNGNLFWESALISPIVDGHGEITHFLAIKEDITQRKQREQEQNALLALAMALRAANGRHEMLPAVLEQSAHIVAAPIAAFAVFNPNTGGLTIEAAYRQGDPLYEAGIPLPGDTGISAAVLHSGEVYCSDDVSTDSRFLMHELVQDERAGVCLPLIANGEPLGVLWVFRSKSFSSDDVRLLSAVSDMAAVALQRAKLHDKVMRYTTDLEAEVATRTKELAEANQQLKELDQLKSKFVSDITHELRTPVTNIGLYLKLLEHKPEKLADYLPILMGQAERLSTLVKDTLDLSRMEHSHDTLNVTHIDLNDLARSVVAAHAARAEEQDLVLEFMPAPGLPLIEGDGDKLTQVVTNLVANALNYTPNGQVTVFTHYNAIERAVKCEVKDTGCGIHFEDLSHVFDRFYRGRRDQIAPVPGTGLGLSIVKEIVELHGGHIDVKSEVGFGSTFTVTFPLPQQTSLTEGA
jgi:PAS domain S-box-containing protein